MAVGSTRASLLPAVAVVGVLLRGITGAEEVTCRAGDEAATHADDNDVILGARRVCQHNARITNADAVLVVHDREEQSRFC